MSSPEDVGTQVHPAGMSTAGDKQLFMDENLHDASDIKESKHEKASDSTWRHSNPQSSKSLVNVRTAFTGGFSSEEEDSDIERHDSNNMSKRMTRSLGRNEMRALFRGSHEIVPVSERTSAYKDLVTSSQSMRTSPKQSPRHSAMKVGSGSDTSPSQSRITSNPFFQLDRLGKLPAESGQRRNTSPANTSSLNASSKGSPSPAHAQSASHSAIGMSVQMRIKIWTEKEKEADKQMKLINRRSLQSSALLNVQSSPPDAKADTGVSSKVECTAHSDDEMIKGRKTTSVRTHENIYDEIDEEIKTYRIKEASSSSESSPSASPSKTSGRNKRKKKTEKESKKEKENSPKAKQSKWKLRSPLPKRKLKVNNSEMVDTARVKSLMKEKQRSREDEEDIDDVFSPAASQSEKKQLVSEGSHASDLDALPSLFDRVNSSTSPINRKKSISHEILDIIGSLGTVEEDKFNPAVSICITEGSHSERNSDSGK